MSELDPLHDLVKELNDQSDLPRFPLRIPARIKVIDSTDGISAGGCWCGREQNHDWLGRVDGAPHPRYP